MAQTNEMPHWDLSAVYPGLDSTEFAGGFSAVCQVIDQLAALFDQHQICRQPTLPVGPEVVAVFEQIAERYNEVVRQARTLGSYIHGFVATDSRNNVAQARRSELDQKIMLLSLLSTRLTAWLGSLDVEALIAASPLAADHAFALRKAYAQAAHLMSPEQEELAALLNLTGGSAWAKLHGNFTSQLVVPVELDGKTQTLPMSAVRNLAYDPNRQVRRCAYLAELETWRQAALPIAAAINSIKGQFEALARRRGWASALDVALFNNHINRQTLEAMLEAARESFPDFRRYLKAKARALGLSALAWYDLFAPVGQSHREWPFAQAGEFIVRQFGSFSPRLQELAQRALAGRWIDAEPRDGKRDGAFCMWLHQDESRILTNYKPAFGGMSTLAHELGHAYHNLNLTGRTMMQRDTPMTLAETASIFCQTIVRQAALQEADAQEQLAILEADLQGSCQVVVDIASRFLFEQRVFEQRQRRELSVDELCARMVEAQQETYGDGLDADALHPYMWAVKPHYYSAGYAFYNFPYMFGLLFGLGLYARYRQDPSGFQERYDDLLSCTGMADAATLAERFGIRLDGVEFWRASLDMVREDIDRFEALVQ